MPLSSLAIDAPLAGKVHPISAVPDPTFAGEMLGPGIAIYPAKNLRIPVSSPASGIIRSIQPHAFVLQTDPQTAILVHLGINTFRSEESFSLLVEKNRFVHRHQSIVIWDLPKTVSEGYEPWVCITLIGQKNSGRHVEFMAKSGSQISAGQRLLEISA